MFLPDLHPVDLVKTFGPGLIAVGTFLEAMGLPLPGESALIAISIYAGTSGKISIAWIVIAAAGGAIMGDNVGFLIGRTLGMRALHRWGRHVGLNQDRLLLGRYLFRCHGGKVVFFGRFLAVLRTFAALLAGANGMDWPRFLVANAAGGIVWACAYGFGAFWFGDAVERLSGPIAIAGGLIVAIAVVAAWVFMRRKEQDWVRRAKEAMPQDGAAAAAAD